MLHTLKARFGREPSIGEVSRELGLSKNGARVPIETLIEKGLYVPGKPPLLNERQKQCLIAIDALERRLGRSPSIRDVSAEMGMSPGGARIHIDALVALGFITKPEIITVMRVTESGKKYLP